MSLGGQELSIETGRMAKQANGSVLVQYGDTMVLVTAVSNFFSKPNQDFFPLQCEYRNKSYAAGKIPGGFIKREGRPSEKEVLSSRLIDRPIRPLFPEGFSSETQIIANCISSDKENLGDILAVIGGSAALSISDIPFMGPIAAVRVGRIDDKFILNPTVQQIETGDLEIIVAGSEESVVMVEGEANEVPENILLAAIEFGQTAIVEIVNFQKELVAEINPEKFEFVAPEVPEGLKEKIIEKVTPNIENWRKLGLQKKKFRTNAIKTFIKELKAEFEEEYPDQGSYISNVVDDLIKEDTRKQIIENSTRLDGRNLSDIRPITCEVGVLPRAHGSALFTRGETQSLATVTLGSKMDEQIIDDIDHEKYFKRFTLHYNFPPFSVGETGRFFGTGRREIGHGNLAERSLKNQAPESEEFPYTIRIVSDILESNGSSSMASVCAGSLSMMDAGVPVKKTVAGIAMGLIKNNDEAYILTDILGSEDHFGDMDFKVTGTKDGVNAIQMDLKVTGISSEIMTKALEQAREGRLKIIDIMDNCIEKPRDDLSAFAPRMLSLKINPKLIGEIIGPGGKRIRELQESTDSNIEIDDDGIVFISASNSEKAEKALNTIKQTLEQPEEGKIYTNCPVKRLEDYGAFVEFLPNKDGLLHISEVAWERTKDIHEVLKIGEKIDIKLLKISDQGKFELSIRELTDPPEGFVRKKTFKKPSRSNDRNRGGRDNKSYHKNR